MCGEVAFAMPIYEYICTVCGSEIEVIQSFSDAPLETCSHCSGKLEKKISASTFHLKGSGWYVTDYARKSSAGNGSNGKPSKETSGSESKSTESSSTENSTTKTETKTETKSETKAQPAKPAST
jgi:putative FmdB family regulatory protein